MDTQADGRTEHGTGEQTEPRSGTDVTSRTKRSSENGVGHLNGHQSGPQPKRAVTPSTFNLEETPEERERRIHDTRAMLKSLLANTPEEVEEQRETWKILKAALIEGRPSYAQLFPDDE